MYNLTTFIAIVQQAIKKPLVTEILLDRSYTWGWRYEPYYDQFLVFGQVIKGFHRRYDNGDWRWFLKKPILSNNSMIQAFAECGHVYGNGRFLLMIFACLIYGYARALASVVTNKESQVLVVPGFHDFHYFNCILHWTFGCW